MIYSELMVGFELYDLLITNELLYQLSYISDWSIVLTDKKYYMNGAVFVTDRITIFPPPNTPNA